MIVLHHYHCIKQFFSVQNESSSKVGFLLEKKNVIRPCKKDWHHSRFLVIVVGLENSDDLFFHYIAIVWEQNIYNPNPSIIQIIQNLLNNNLRGSCLVFIIHCCSSLFSYSCIKIWDYENNLKQRLFQTHKNHCF